MRRVRISLVHPRTTLAPQTSFLEFPVEMEERQWGFEASWVGEVADPHELSTRLGPLAALAGWDLAVVEGALVERPPRLLVMDVDSTLITAEVIDLLAREAGSGVEVARITEQAMRGELDFTQSLHRRVSTLSGLPVSVFEEVMAAITFSPGALDLIAAARRNDCRVGLVSGGFIEIVSRLADRVGVDFAVANGLEVADGFLSGATRGEIVDRSAKLRHAKEFASQVGCGLDEVVAVGDGANDLELLGGVGLGVAYCAKPVTARLAKAAISFPRLDAVAAFARF